MVLLKIANKLPTLKTVVYLDDEIDEAASKMAAAANIKLVKITDLEKEGKEKPTTPTKVSTDSIATISFTSGTTGYLFQPLFS